MNNSTRYISVNIYRSNNYSCSLNVCNNVNSVYLAHPRGNYTKQDVSDNNGIIIELGYINAPFSNEKYIHVKPAINGTFAAGGSFVYSSDARFQEISKQPISLHDRDMSKE